MKTIIKTALVALITFVAISYYKRTKTDSDNKINNNKNREGTGASSENSDIQSNDDDIVSNDDDQSVCNTTSSGDNQTIDDISFNSGNIEKDASNDRKQEPGQWEPGGSPAEFYTN